MCIFCDIASGVSLSWTIYQDDLVTAFFDYFPASSGHVLILPNQHHENIFEIPEDTLTHLIKVSKKIATVYRDVLGVTNMNILQNNGPLAGQTVFHYHVHIIPRSEGDTVQFGWEYDENLRENYDALKEKISEKLK